MADFGALFKNGGGNVNKAEKLGNYKVTYLHYTKLVKSPYQYREFSQEDIDSIVDLITAAGSVLQPVLVRKIDADEYEIIAGHQRCEGIRYLVEKMGLEKYALVPCMITNMDDVDAELNVVVSNIRKVQTPYETLHQINVLRRKIKKYPERFPDLPQKGTVAERVALRMGMSRTVVSEYVKISNNLGERGMELFAKGEIDKSAAMELAGFPEEEQKELIKKGILTYAEIKKYRKEKDAKIRELQKPKEEEVDQEPDDALPEEKKELSKPDKAAYEYLDAAARHLIKSWNDWMQEDFSRRVADVMTSPGEIKKKLEGQSRYFYFATEAGVSSINLFDEYVQIWDENSRCIGDYDWFYLASAIQSQWNVVSLERGQEKMQTERGHETAAPGPVPEQETCATSGPTLRCIHLPEYGCFLTENEKRTPGNGTDCEKHCCWECPKHGSCNLECNASGSRPEVVAAEPDPQKAEEKSIDSLNLSSYTREILNNAGINTVAQLRAMDREHLVKVRSMSNRRLEEIKKALVGLQEDTIQPEDMCGVAQAQELDVIDGECRECCDGTETPTNSAKTQRKDMDVLRDMLMKEKADLEEWVKVDKVDPLPPEMIQKKKLLVDALASMLCDLEDGKEQEGYPQPELPLFKNNDQRKEWLRNYKDWGLWYEDSHIGVKYYKYQFDNGAALVAEVYHQPATRHTKEYDASYLHLIGGPEPPKGTYGIGKWAYHKTYCRQPNSETELIEFLKEIQKENTK